MKRALKFAKDLGNHGNTYKESTGWLALSLKRNNNVFGTMTSEGSGVNIEQVGEKKKQLPTIRFRV